MNEKKFLRPKQAAKRFNLSESFFRHGIMTRSIPSYKLGKARFVEENEIAALIEAGRTPATR
jgi:hypothetical protein